MRITNAMMMNNFKTNLGANARRLDHAMNQLVTGRRNPRLSDDPTSIVFAQTAERRLAQLEHFQRSVRVAEDWLVSVEGALMDLQNRMGTELYEAVTQGANDVYRPEDRVNIAQIVGEMRDHVVDTLNTSFTNRFIFGGFNTPGAPMTGGPLGPFRVGASGDLYFNEVNLSVLDGIPSAVFAWDGTGAPPPPFTLADINTIATGIGLADAQELQDLLGVMHDLRSDVKHVDVAPAVRMPVTMSGIDVLFFRTTDVDGNEVIRNMFSMLTDIYNDLNDPSITAVDLTLFVGQLQDSQNSLLSRTAEVGGRVRRLELLESRYSADYVNYNRIKSNVRDIDYAEAATNFAMAELAFQSALQAGARVIQPTLMDFLR